jgi:YD repeat-containing protein
MTSRAGRSSLSSRRRILVDSRGHPTTHRFNASGLVTRTTDALGQATAYDRDPASNLFMSTTDPLGRQTSYKQLQM